MGTRKTSEKVRRFAALYAGQCGTNGREAARLAGYRGKPSSLDSVASRLLKHPAVQEALDRVAARIEATAEEAVRIIAEQMRGGMGDFLTIQDGKVVIDFAKAHAAGKLHLVKTFSVDKTTGSVTSLELHDQQAAAVQIAKIKGAYREHDAGALAHATTVIVNTGILDNDPVSAGRTGQAPAGPQAEK